MSEYQESFRAAVLGHPISHSLSPNLHRAVLEEYDLAGSYVAIDVTEDQLPHFVSEMDDTWVGLSLTMPLKVKILELIQSRDELVNLTKSANTVYRMESGQLSLANTDVFGIKKALQVSGVDTVERVLIIGSGATARSAVIAVRQLGATFIYVQSRNSNSRQLMVDLVEQVGGHGTSGEINYAEAGDFDLVISTLPSGVAHAEDVSFESDIRATLLDVSYSPWPTALATLWPNENIIGGKEMLLWQATRQVEMFYGVPAPVESMRRALEGTS